MVRGTLRLVYGISMTLCVGGMMYAQPTIFLKTSDINVRGGYHIRRSGTYILTEDVLFTQVNATAISVHVDDVTIDLDGRTLRAANASGENIGINIVRAANNQTNANRDNITIRNGKVANFNVFSIRIDTGSTNILLENLDILSSSIRGATALTPSGIFFDGAVPIASFVDARTTDVVVKNCNVNNSRFGLRARAVDNVKVTNCTFNNNASRGISALDCNVWELENCQASKQQLSDELGNFGLLLLGGSFWHIKNCDFSFNTITAAVNAVFPSVGGAQFQPLVDGNLNLVRDTGSHVIENCTFSNNSTTIPGNFCRGLALVQSSSCVVRNCIANGNTSVDSFQAGFLDDSSNANLYVNCIANGNRTQVVTLFGTFGFIANASSGICFINCTAKRNLEPSGGFGAGFFVSGTSSDSLVQNSLAVANDPIGFANASPSSVFVGNFAFGNPFNYSSIGGPLGFITVINGVQPGAGTFDERQIDNISIV